MITSIRTAQTNRETPIHLISDLVSIQKCILVGVGRDALRASNDTQLAEVLKYQKCENEINGEVEKMANETRTGVYNLEASTSKLARKFSWLVGKDYPDMILLNERKDKSNDFINRITEMLSEKVQDNSFAEVDVYLLVKCAKESVLQFDRELQIKHSEKMAELQTALNVEFCE